MAVHKILAAFHFTPGPSGSEVLWYSAEHQKRKRYRSSNHRGLTAFGVPKGVKEGPPLECSKWEKKEESTSINWTSHLEKSHLFEMFYVYIMYINIYIYMIYMFVLRFLFRLIHVHERFSTCFFFVGWVFLHHSRLEQWTVPPAGKSMTPMGKLHRSQWWKVTP